MPQIIYNVTVNVDDDIHQEWLTWMREVHIPEVMATGLFLSNRMLRVVTQLGEEDSGTTYAIQYTLKEIKDFLTYSDNYAPALRQKTLDKYGNKAIAFRTLLEVVE
jgi:hypothetical protein